MSVKLIALVLALGVSVALASPAKKSNYIEQENSCRQVCGVCDCDGFYCEDECICECNLEEDGNLQCIADMKKECDRNGLEYELVMQESTKDRFLREVQGNTFDLNKHLVILKQKRDSPAPQPQHDKPPHDKPYPNAPKNANPADGAAPPKNADPTVGNAPDESVGMPLTSLVASLNGKSAIAGTDLQASKLLVLIRERLANFKQAPIVPIAPIAPIAPIVLPKIVVTTLAPRVAPAPYKFSLPEFKKFSALPAFPKISASSDLIVQPGNTLD